MSRVDLSQLVCEKVKSLKAYHVDHQDCDIQLHANENSFAPPQEILDLLQDHLKTLQLNRYPDPDSNALKQTIATKHKVSKNQLMIGNGSDELIQILLQMFCDSGDSVAFPDPTFAMYSIIARGMGFNPVTVPLDECWGFNADDFLNTITSHNPKIIFLSYPNNPTGNCFSPAEIQKVIERFDGIVVLDEAYHDFSKKSFIDQQPNHNNLVILRSLSKIGLAALRVGFAVADPIIIDEANKIRLPYNSNTLSQEFSDLLLNNFDPVQAQIETILQERSRLLDGLSKLQGVTVFPSDANFFLFRVDQDSGKLFESLKSRGILIRDLNAHPRLKNCLRVTVGTPEENNRFLSEMGTLRG